MGRKNKYPQSPLLDVGSRCQKCGVRWVRAWGAGDWRPGCDCPGLDGDHPPADGSAPFDPSNFPTLTRREGSDL